MGPGSLQGKTVFLGGSGAILEFLEWLEGLGVKDRGSCEIWEFFGDFLWIFGSGLGPICNYFLELRGPVIFPMRGDRRLTYDNLRDLFAKW
jgi:hypothetical protein